MSEVQQPQRTPNLRAAGVIIAGNVYIVSTDSLDDIKGTDYVYALLLWVYLLVIRAAMFLLSAPLLRRCA